MWRSGGGAALLDESGQGWDIGVVWHSETRAEIVPECDSELCAGLGEAEEGIAAIATGVASGASADLSLDDLAADVVLRSVGVERDFGPIEHHEQFAFVGMEPREQRSRVTKPVLRLKIRSNRARRAALRWRVGCWR